MGTELLIPFLPIQQCKPCQLPDRVGSFFLVVDGICYDDSLCFSHVILYSSSPVSSSRPERSIVKPLCK